MVPDAEQVADEDGDLQRVWRNSGISSSTPDDGGWAQAVAAHASSRQTSRYQAQFANAPDASRIPEGIEVALGANAAPFEHTSPDQYRTSRTAENGIGMSMEHTTASRPRPAAPDEKAPVSSKRAADSVDVHDELEWMRNNLSHLGDQINQLTAVVQQTHDSQKGASAAGTVQIPDGRVSWSHRICDNILYLVSGLFVLFALDMVYRAGCRASRR